MKTLSLVAALVTLSATSAFAATKAYQVTGPVLELTDSAITVQKGSEKWEIAKGGAKIPETIKVGSKVTVYYSMTAGQVEDKSPAPKAEKPAKVDAKVEAPAKADAKAEKKAK